MEALADKPLRILRNPEVRHRTGYSNATLYRRIAADAFPQPISLGGSMVGWVESEIDQHIEDLIEASRKAS